MKRHVATLTLSLACAVAAAHAQATQLITGNATADERARIMQTIGNISRIATEPQSAAALLTRGLKRTECFELERGPGRCMYWNPSLGEGSAITLDGLDLVSKDRPGDFGGDAFWSLRSDICVDTAVFGGLGVARVERYSLPPEPFGDGDGVDVILQSYRNVLCGWGSVGIKIRVRNGCAISVHLHIVKDR